MGDNPVALWAGHQPEIKPIKIDKPKIRKTNHQGTKKIWIDCPPNLVAIKLSQVLKIFPKPTPMIMPPIPPKRPIAEASTKNKFLTS